MGGDPPCGAARGLEDWKSLQAGKPPLKIEPLRLGASRVKHGVCRVTAFRILGPSTLEVDFDDGVSQTMDFSPVLEGELYGPLRDSELFNQVKIDPEVHTLVWPNGADFDPATLHDWPELAAALAAAARRWAEPAKGPR